MMECAHPNENRWAHDKNIDKQKSIGYNNNVRKSKKKFFNLGVDIKL